jgi:hypothetical protein
MFIVIGRALQQAILELDCSNTIKQLIKPIARRSASSFIITIL